jgi:hypothetical protein
MPERVIRLEINSTERSPKRIYEFDPDAVFESNGNSYEYISFKKIQIDRNGGKKFQNLTVSKDNWIDFVGFLQQVLAYAEENAEDVPF